MSVIKYRPEIDGLRALAILPVLVFHLNPEWLVGGFMGVDVFFVISGYLITSIILAEHKAGTFSFYGFWERRVRRIFPALGFMLLVVLLFGFVIFYPPVELSLLGKQAIKVLSLVSNQYMFSIAEDYWGPSASLIPLLHTWSLALEEQFYLILPPLVFLCFTFRRPRLLAWILGILLVCSLVYGLWQINRNQSAAFYLLLPRAWELLTGSLLAILVPKILAKNTQTHYGWLSDLGILIIVLGYCFVTEMDFPGWKALVPVLGTALFISYAPHGGYAQALLSRRPIIFIGKISYSLYLWHWPALVFGKLFADLFELPSIRWLALLGSTFIAIWSYYWIEKLGKQQKNIWLFSGILASSIIAVSLLAAFNKRNLTPSFINQTEYKGRLYEAVYENRNLNANRYAYIGIKHYVPQIEKPINTIGFQSIKINSNQAKQIIVLGDSHALMWGSLIERIAQKNNIGCEFWTVSGASPFLDSAAIPRARLSSAQRAEFNKQKIKAIEQHRPKIVIISTRLDSKWHAGADVQDIEGIHDLIIAVHQASPQSHILIIGQPPMGVFGDQNAVQWLGWREKFYSSDTVKRAEALSWSAANQYINNLTTQYPYVDVVRVSDIYESTEGRIEMIKNKSVLYIDDDHLSEFGASLAETRIRSAIERRLN